MSSGIIIITGMADSLSSLPVQEQNQIRRRLHLTACVDPFSVSELQSYVSRYIAFFVDPAADRVTACDLLVRFGKAFVHNMEYQTVHSVKKELETFLTNALHNERMLPRSASALQRHLTVVDISDRKWWDTMYSDMRDYVLPLQVLQEYVDHNRLASGNQ
jgi:hypothetical protein